MPFDRDDVEAATRGGVTLGLVDGFVGVLDSRGVEWSGRGFPVESSGRGFPVELPDVGFPVESSDVGFPVESADLGFPVELSGRGLPNTSPSHQRGDRVH